MVLESPFMTVLEEDIDFSLQDSLNAVNRLFAREQMVAEICQGIRNPDDLLDLLSDQRMDTDAYVDEVEENIEYLLVYPRLEFNM